MGVFEVELTLTYRYRKVMDLEDCNCIKQATDCIENLIQEGEMNIDIGDTECYGWNIYDIEQTGGFE